MNTVVKNKVAHFQNNKATTGRDRIAALARKRGLRWRAILRQAQGRLFRRYPAGVDLAWHQRINRSDAPRWATLTASPNMKASIIGILFSSSILCLHFHPRICHKCSVIATPAPLFCPPAPLPPRSIPGAEPNVKKLHLPSTSTTTIK